MARSVEAARSEEALGMAAAKAVMEKALSESSSELPAVGLPGADLAGRGESRRLGAESGGDRDVEEALDDLVMVVENGLAVGALVGLDVGALVGLDVVLAAEVAVDPGGHGKIPNVGLVGELLVTCGGGTKSRWDEWRVAWMFMKKKNKAMVDMYGTSWVSDGVGAGFPDPIMGRAYTPVAESGVNCSEF